ncbi:MAG: ATP-binding cassette domain-containing protein [Verrucomicrobia bacterium]|nr:MAG: ATP-binding cassette domain-containing protein [Verrucomicrobiota bacterium]
MKVIEVRELTRVFRTRRKEPGLRGAVRGLFRRQMERTCAVDRISFDIEEGELVGFLGPNGAGKTTTLKMLAGLLHPTSGEARVLGYVPWERDDRYRRQFALVLGQKNQLWWDLPAWESLELNAEIYGLPRRQFEETVEELSTLLQVRDRLGVMVRELSLGERMKMELIAALLHRPRVLYLDEPTIGLDVVSQQTVREFVRHYNATRRTTILLTSHYMADIQALCRRVIVIHRGRLLFDGRLEDILDRFVDFKLITIDCEPGAPVRWEVARRFGDVETAEAGRLQLRVKRQEVIPACKALLEALPVRDIDIQELPVEEVIRRLFTDGLDPAESPAAPPNPAAGGQAGALH